VVARSTAEAEFDPWHMVYVSYYGCIFLLTELRLSQSKPMVLYCDNKATIDIANNLVQHDHTKHVELDHHFIMKN
jgi:hypothetical protein